MSDVFGVYRDNELQTGGKPLLFGKTSTSDKILCINTRNTSLSSGSTDSGTRLIVNGEVTGNSFNSFTGVHDINFESSVDISTLEEGMILSTTGNTTKNSIVNVKAEVNLSSTQNDKKVYGVYFNSETLQNFDNLSLIHI